MLSLSPKRKHGIRDRSEQGGLRKKSIIGRTPISVPGSTRGVPVGNLPLRLVTKAGVYRSEPAA